MPGKGHALADVTETTAGNIEAARLGHDGNGDEDRHQTGDDGQAAEIKPAGDQGESAEDLQPGKKEGETHTDGPGNGFVVIDVVGKTDRVENLGDAGVDEQAADREIENAEKE